MALTMRHVGILLVVMAIGTAGCLGGGGGGDSGDGTTADTTTEAMTTTTTEAMTTTTTEAMTTTTTEAMTTTTTEAMTTTPASTGGCGVSATGGTGTVDLSQHSSSLKDAGSYTVEATASTGGFNVSITEQAEIDTGERYQTTTLGSRTSEFYTPPNSETVYQLSGGEAREVPSSRASFVEFSNTSRAVPNSDIRTLQGIPKAGTGQTPLGAADVYVISSPEQLPNGTFEQFDEVKSVCFVMWVDQDTGILSKYNYTVTAVQGGQERTSSVRLTLSDVGSTTVEKPDWVPESSSDSGS